MRQYLWCWGWSHLLAQHLPGFPLSPCNTVLSSQGHTSYPMCVISSQQHPWDVHPVFLFYTNDGDWDCSSGIVFCLSGLGLDFELDSVHIDHFWCRREALEPLYFANWGEQIPERLRHWLCLADLDLNLILSCSAFSAQVWWSCTVSMEYEVTRLILWDLCLWFPPRGAEWERISL
jgi:hypothetical protein